MSAGNIVPMIEVRDTAAARAAGGLPAAAWDGLDLARAAGRAARLTLCVGWTTAMVEDPGAPATKTGRPAKKARDVATESLALRVPGLLWVGWERIVGAGKWKPVGGQMLRAASDGGGVARCTQAQATRALRVLGSGDGSA